MAMQGILKKKKIRTFPGVSWSFGVNFRVFETSVTFFLKKTLTVSVEQDATALIDSFYQFTLSII